MAGNIYQYVCHQDAKKFEALGWVYDDGSTDDGVTARYRWAGKGRPVWPDYDEEMAARELEAFDYVFGLDGEAD